MSKAKRNSLLLLGTVSVLIIIIAMSLPNLTLSPGQPFALEQAQLGIGGISATLPGGQALVWVIRGIIGLALIIFPLYVVFSLFTPEGRKRLIADIILIGILLLLTSFIQKLPAKEQKQEPQPINVAPQNLNGDSGLPISVFSPTPPTWLTPAVILIGSVLVVIIIFIAIRFFQRIPSSDFSLEELAQEAQNAIQSLNTGGDLKVTVIHCYHEMTRIVKQQKGIERDATMTVREFEDHLVGTGLPQEALKTLTRLFEQVRYGGALAGGQEEKLALSCLTDIVNACMVIGGRHEAG
ncbi:MAG: DUF4129 domain-containing protein [Anaerolineae bacterium]|nr:DUF4129 domain-containing protein [Anaerolineae bacterium]